MTGSTGDFGSVFSRLKKSDISPIVVDHLDLSEGNGVMGRAIAWHSTSRFATDEALNQWTHGFGFLVSLPAGWWLLRAATERANSWLLLGCVIYVVSQSLLYGASTLSHSVHRGIWRHRFRSLDQICIFLFIAGSFSPFGMTYLSGGWWNALLAMMLVMALAGVAAKIFFTKFDNVGVWFYLLVGWVPILAIPHYLRCFGVDGCAWIFAGAAAYSTGTWFLAHDERPFFHPVWHVLVLLGSSCHYVLILNYVVGCCPMA